MGAASYPSRGAGSPLQPRFRRRSSGVAVVAALVLAPPSAFARAPARSLAIRAPGVTPGDVSLVGVPVRSTLSIRSLLGRLVVDRRDAIPGGVVVLAGAVPSGRDRALLVVEELVPAGSAAPQGLTLRLRGASPAGRVQSRRDAIRTTPGIGRGSLATACRRLGTLPDARLAGSFSRRFLSRGGFSDPALSPGRVGRFGCNEVLGRTDPNQVEVLSSIQAPLLGPRSGDAYTGDVRPGRGGSLALELHNNEPAAGIRPTTGFVVSFASARYGSAAIVSGSVPSGFSCRTVPGATGGPGSASAYRCDGTWAPGRILRLTIRTASPTTTSAGTEGMLTVRKDRPGGAPAYMFTNLMLRADGFVTKAAQREPS